YKLAEYQKGQYLLFKVNEEYWGPVKPKIAEVKYMGRGEQAVRGAMAQAGEADVAMLLSPELVKGAAQTIVEDPQEAAGVRINHEHPVLKDVRVRQAIVESIDTLGIIKSLFPSTGIQLNGQVLREGAVGYNPNLKPYPYKPDEAKQLMQAAGAVG